MQNIVNIPVGTNIIKRIIFESLNISFYSCVESAIAISLLAYVFFFYVYMFELNIKINRKRV